MAQVRLDGMRMTPKESAELLWPIETKLREIETGMRLTGQWKGRIKGSFGGVVEALSTLERDGMTVSVRTEILELLQHPNERVRSIASAYLRRLNRVIEERLSPQGGLDDEPRDP